MLTYALVDQIWYSVHENTISRSLLSQVCPAGRMFCCLHFDCLTLAVDSGEQEMPAVDQIQLTHLHPDSNNQKTVISVENLA